jgi:hypothetical protein
MHNSNALTFFVNLTKNKSPCTSQIKFLCIRQLWQNNFHPNLKRIEAGKNMNMMHDSTVYKNHVHLLN